MGSLFGHRRSGNKPANVPRYPTRQEIIDLFLKYYGTMPEEEAIIANMGNPGGPAAIEKMLKDSLDQAPQEPPPSISPIPPIDPNAPTIPYSGPTEPVRIATGSGWIRPVGMAYWNIINQHANDDKLKVVLSLQDTLHVFTMAKSNLALLDSHSLDITSTGEFCYFSRIRPNILFVPIGDSLYEVNISDGSRRVVMAAPAGLCWQPHTSYDDTVHSCCNKTNEGQEVSWQVNGRIYPIQNEPDECQIDKSGQFLLCKEKVTVNGVLDEYNRIIHLSSGNERIIHDQEGAVGHSDCGFGCAMGENDKSNLGGCLQFHDFLQGTTKPIYSTGIWNMGYFSFCNARPNVPLGDQRGLLTTPYEIISIKLGGMVEGQEAGRAICPIVSPNRPYEHRVKACICPEGQFYAFSMMQNGELQAFIGKIPVW